MANKIRTSKGVAKKAVANYEVKIQLKPLRV